MLRMKPDLYTKAVLTVIAFMLVMIGCRQYASPTIAVKAGSQFANLVFSANNSGYSFFDLQTGEIWEYQGPRGLAPGRLDGKLKLSQIGQPLIREK
jgi:hypothetical protein